jgi:glycosyltransferase involved in cell wall biosynthesis
MNKLLILIPTKNRVRTLGRCLAALLAQTFQDYDLCIVNDNPSLELDSDPATAQWLMRHKKLRRVGLKDGLGIGQVYAHNLALWQKPWRDYEYILRLDDDVLLNAFAIEHMHRTISQDKDIAAVTGLWFENEMHDDWHSDRDVPTSEEWKEAELDGKVDEAGIVSNWHQRLYHDMRLDGAQILCGPMRVDHCYGSMMYRAEDMRRAGGWPEIYSYGVHHGEETDGSYRLYLTGKQLWLMPSVTGQHLRGSGGIRSLGIDVEQQQRVSDDPLRNRRLQKMPGTYDRKLTVGVWSQHAIYVGGGPHEFFKTVRALQQSEYFDVWMLGDHMPPDAAEKHFGVSVEPQTKEPPEVFDVIIQMGDDLDWFEESTPLRYQSEARLLYVFYPFGERAPGAEEFCKIVANSKYGANAVAHKWGWEAGHIYPLVTPIDRRRTKKRNWILLAGRIDQWKGTLWVMEAFAEIAEELPDWELHVVGAAFGSVQEDYIKQVFDFAEQHSQIKVHADVNYTKLKTFYKRSKILISAKGILAEPDYPEEAEHFGIMPVEAISAGCVPLVYDLGGHRETVPDNWRWKTRDQLKDLILKVAGQNGDVFPDMSSFYDQDRYAQEWEKLVLQANVGAVGLRQAGKESWHVIAKKPVLAIVCDTPVLPKEHQRYPPRMYTGFGVVAGQIVPAFFDDFEIHYYAILDSEDARPGEFPWTHHRMDKGDEQGEKRLIDFMVKVKPDIIWSLYDPGNIFKYLVFNEFGLQAWQGHSRVPVVAYFPVEGTPIPEGTGRMVDWVQRSGGQAITYTEAGANAVKEHFDHDIGWCYHGLDHADFKPYSDAERAMLRKLVGLEDRFCVGSFGVNKRVKQYDLLVYAATYLKEWGYDDVLFYLHTEPEAPILQGYPLDQMVKDYDVEEMFLWKPDTYKKRGGQYTGAAYEGDTLTWVSRMTQPPTPQGRGAMFGAYDITARYNCLDLYVDCSSVEGWNLPLGEAMRCGVPSISVRDPVREEIYGKGTYMLLPSNIPTTWHNGVKLLIVNPFDLAKNIARMHDGEKLRAEYAQRGIDVTDQYKWQAARDYMLAIVKKAVKM